MMRPLGRLPLWTSSYGTSALRVLRHGNMRTRPVLLSRLGALRYETTGDHNSGHIETAGNEGVMFFNNVFPLKLQGLLGWSISSEKYLEHRGSAALGNFDPVKAFTDAMGKDSPVKISGVTPRLKDGAAFLRFTHPPGMSTEDVDRKVRTYMRENPFRPWWNPFSRTRAHLVLGKPWIEDLFRPPSCRLRVEFDPDGVTTEGPPDLSQETLFGLFRPYGKLREIQSQPPDSKILPKFAYVDFSSAKRAIMAKNCMHGFYVKDADTSAILAKLKIGYERTPKANWIRDWLLNHPRIVIPLLIALAGTVTVAIFDPMRTFFIKSHISRAFHIADNKLYKWFASQASSVVGLSRRHESPGFVAIVNDRRQEIEQIKTWLMETADTFIIVQGPRGSGKKELVGGQALTDRKYTLIIDCKKIQDARGDSATINATADAVGYKPVFSWMNSISGLIDLAAKGAAGVETGFSETLDGQLNKILASTSSALRELALDSRTKKDSDFSFEADAYLEAHPEKRPVLVIDNFLHKATESTVIYDKLAEWAADLTSANTAHVIFLTTDVSFSKSLSKALPDRVFRQISLGDLPADAAKRFVTSHLEPDTDDTTKPTDDASSQPKSKRRSVLAELDECINSLGGRLTDLEFLARRIRAGETPKNAVKQIIDQSSSEILKMYVLSGGADRQWTPQQAWAIISQLATSDDGLLRYGELGLHDAFSSAAGGPDAVLQALEQAELISIVSANGRPCSIKPGKPVFLPAFRLLAGDTVLKARLDLALLAERLKSENSSVDKAEAELHLLGELPKQPFELTDRIRWLLAKLQTSHVKIEAWEKEVAGLKKVLQTEY